MNGANLSQGACVREDENTTRLPEKVRTMLSGCVCRCAHREVPRKHGCRHWTFVSWSVTQAYTSSLAFGLCFVTHLYIILVFPLLCPNSHLVVML